jgi:Dolichyl-phosphate-mannose-protein mannosyltransferase
MTSQQTGSRSFVLLPIKAWSHKQLTATFYLAWTIISCIQAWGTELFDDEAYYWVYAQFLDWGYFDHPPMIALLIKAGTFFLPGELGVRLFIVLMGILTIRLLELLTAPQYPRLFYALILQMGILQIGGIIAVPDIPLLFFTVLFFIAFHHFAHQQGWKEVVFLALVIALLLYSKYHGILIVLFSLLAHLHLLKKPQTWLVAILSILLFYPHVQWQLDHGMPSVNYHLFERLSPPYRISFTLDYLVGQLLIAGPLIGWILIWAAFRHKPQRPVEKAMYWSMAGIYLLFFISSFRSRTEANWTVPLVAPLVLLAYRHIAEQERWQRWVFRLLPFSLLLVLLVRIHLLFDIPFLQQLPKGEFHQNREWTTAVKQQAAGAKVVFTDSYQRASKYWFYTGDTAFSLNTPRYRRNNYNLWPMEMKMLNKRVLMVGSKGAALVGDSIYAGRMPLVAAFDNQFRSFSRITIAATSDMQTNEAGLLETILELGAPTQKTIDSALWYRPRLTLVVYRGPKQSPLVLPTAKRLFPDFDNSMYVRMQLPDSLQEKKYTVRWALESSFVEPSINSRAYTLVNGRSPQ